MSDQCPYRREGAWCVFCAVMKLRECPPKPAGAKG
jgi:hypothetical protein